MSRRLIVRFCCLSVIVFFSQATLATTAVLEALSREISRTGLNYFLENAHPDTGLVRDRADNFRDTPASNRVASIAATGFGLAVVANASIQGLMESAKAEEYVLRALRFSRDHVPRYHGWFLHFVDWQTGARMWNSEYSTIDTALFLAGALYASQVFEHNAEISQITRQIYRETDFIDFMTDGGTKPDKRTLSMAWGPENGYTPAQWNMYAEEMILLVLGLGHPEHPLPTEAWRAWQRKMSDVPDRQTLMGLSEALFVHQYSQIFLDLRTFHDGFPNYHENSRRMTLYHRTVARADHRYRTLREGFWGFSAGDSPDGYRVASPLYYQSTVCVGCVVASAMLDADDVLADLSGWLGGAYKSHIWGRYGFIDSLDLDRNWFGQEVIGITVGPAFLAQADRDEETSVWKAFMKIPEIKSGLARAASISPAISPSISPAARVGVH